MLVHDDLLATGGTARALCDLVESLGGVVAGCGFGLGFLGAFRTLAGLAMSERRSQLIATIYVVAYLSFSIPSVVAGVLATHIGLHDTAIGFGIAVAALALIALPATARHCRRC